jgi:Cation transporter/ATPase, N-terminus
MAREAAIKAQVRSEAAAAPPGLTSVEARRRLGEFGANTVTEEATPRWRAFLAKFWGPVPWMLEAAIVLQLGLGQYIEATVVGALFLFNATLGVIQEGRAGAALAALKKRLAPTALVHRDGEWVRVPAAEIVPGDARRLPLGAIAALPSAERLRLAPDTDPATTLIALVRLVRGEKAQSESGVPTHRPIAPARRRHRASARSPASFIAAARSRWLSRAGRC